MRRLIALVSVALLVLAAGQAVSGQSAPTENECRPHIEKALKELTEPVVDATPSQAEDADEVAALSSGEEDDSGGDGGEVHDADVVATPEDGDSEESSVEMMQSDAAADETTEAAQGEETAETEASDEASQEVGGEVDSVEITGGAAEGVESAEDTAEGESVEAVEEAADGGSLESVEDATEGESVEAEEGDALSRGRREATEDAEQELEGAETVDQVEGVDSVEGESQEGDGQQDGSQEEGSQEDDSNEGENQGESQEAAGADASLEQADEAEGESQVAKGGEDTASAESVEQAEDVASTEAAEGDAASEEEAGSEDQAAEDDADSAEVSGEDNAADEASTEEVETAGEASSEEAVEGEASSEKEDVVGEETSSDAAPEGEASVEEEESPEGEVSSETVEVAAEGEASSESAPEGEASVEEESPEGEASSEAVEEAVQGGASSESVEEGKEGDAVESEEATEGEATESEATDESVESEAVTTEEAVESAEEPEAAAEEAVEVAAEPAAPVDEEEAEPTPEEELSFDVDIPENLRPRDHIAQILRLDEDSVEDELMQVKTAEATLKELKRFYDSAIKPLEILYKYRDLSNRHFGDPEIFSKPLVLFMGPWSGGKSSIINYLLDNEYKRSSLRTGAEPSPAYFNILMWGEREEVLDGTQLAADWTFSGLQKFGQGLLDRLRGLRLNNRLLEKVNIVEIPGILEIRKQVERLFPFNDACQWFIDRADIIFLVYDPAKLDVGPETEAILDQLKGREYQTRIVLNKADQVRPEELMRVQGTLIWNISPLMSSTQPPVMYSTSLWSMPYEIGAPLRLLRAQERAFLRDMRDAIDHRVENKIASARRFAVRVRNHAKMVDCYLTTYYNHKSFFGNRKKVADDIIEKPQDYHIYEGLSTLTNISRYDLPDPDTYRDFFRVNPLYEFELLASTCTYFKGCPINRLDVTIAYELPELVGKYKKAAEAAVAKTEPKS